MSKDFFLREHNLTATHWSLKNGYDYVAMANTSSTPYPIAGNSNYQIGLVTHVKYLEKNCRGIHQSHKLILHSSIEPPHQFYDFVFAPVFSSVMIIPEPKIVDTSETLVSYDPHVRQCYFDGERQLRFFKIYTQRNCESECFAALTKMRCNCSLFFMPSKNFVFELFVCAVIIIVLFVCRRQWN